MDTKRIRHPLFYGTGSVDDGNSDLPNLNLNFGVPVPNLFVGLTSYKLTVMNAIWHPSPSV